MLSVEYVLKIMEDHPLFAYDDIVFHLCDWFGLKLEDCEIIVDDAVATAICSGIL